MSIRKDKMKLLLNNELAPITFCWGFLQAPLETITESLTQWRLSLGKKMTCTSINDVLSKALLNLEPLSAPPHRELLFSTQSTWTAYFNNPIIGGDPFSSISYLAENMNCWGITIKCAPNMGNSYGAVGFTLFAPEKREWLNEERSILAMNDGGRWKFFTRGKELEFEQTEQYKQKRIADRFTSEMLEEYCAHFDIDLFNPEFYGTEGRLIVTHNAAPPGFPHTSLAEARKKFDI